MSSPSPSQNDDRLLELCKNVSTEKDAQKITKLIRELNDELDEWLTSEGKSAPRGKS